MNVTKSRNDIPETDYVNLLRNLVLEKGLKTGSFLLSSGKHSNYFFDLKPIILDPNSLLIIAKIIAKQVRDLKVDAIGGLETGAIPIAVATALEAFQSHDSSVKSFYVRKEVKNHGTDNLVEGPIQTNNRVLLVDDVTTTGSSLLSTAKEVDKFGAEIIKAIAIVDREEGAKDLLRENNVSFASILTTEDFPNLKPLKNQGKNSSLSQTRLSRC